MIRLSMINNFLIHFTMKNLKFLTLALVMATLAACGGEASIIDADDITATDDAVVSEETTADPYSDTVDQDADNDSATLLDGDFVVTGDVNWIGRKVLGEHEGTIDLSKGNLVFENGEIAGGSFDIDMSSITVTDLTGDDNQKLVGHLMSDDFFGVENYPTATFEITSAQTTDGSSYELTGDLTIKETTAEETLDVTVAENADGTLAATATMIIDRTIYDVRYGSGKFFDGLGDSTIDDEFELQIELTAEQV